MSLSIGQVARAAHVNTETIRYYERKGLLAPPPRTSAGYRQYSPQAVRQIRFMKRAQALGFTLAEIATLLELRSEPGSACERVVEEADRAMTRIADKIRELRRMNHALAELVSACREQRVIVGCPMLEALEREGPENDACGSS